MTDRERLIAVYEAAMAFSAQADPERLRIALDAAKAISAMPKDDDGEKIPLGFKADR